MTKPGAQSRTIAAEAGLGSPRLADLSRLDDKECQKPDPTKAAREVFVWQRQIAEDGELTLLAHRVAIMISQLVDRRKGYAYVAHEKLRTMLKISRKGVAKPASRRGIQNAIQQLTERGYLDVEVGRSNGVANRYRLVSLKPARE